MDCFKIGIYQLFCKKSARLEQIKGFKQASLLFTIGGRIVDSAHPQFWEGGCTSQRATENKQNKKNYQT